MVHIMISMDELKPILEPILSEREDSATIIESIQGIDRPAEEPDYTAHDAEINKAWNDRFMKAFFGEKGGDLNTEVPQDEVDETVNEVTAEDIGIDDILKEEGE